MKNCPDCGAPVTLWQRDFLSGRCRTCQERAAAERRQRRQQEAADHRREATERWKARQQQEQREREEAERAAMEATYQRYLSAADLPRDDSMSRFVLTVGQGLSILAALAAPVVTLAQLSAAAELARWHSHDPVRGLLHVWILLGGALSFALSVALAVVFHRAKGVARLADWQRAVVYKLQEVIKREEQRAGPQ